MEPGNKNNPALAIISILEIVLPILAFIYREFYLIIQIAGITISLFGIIYVIFTNNEKLSIKRRFFKLSIFLLSVIMIVFWITVIIRQNCITCEEENQQQNQVSGINSYFESIRNNDAALTAFFSQMPKGGDLHNHYSGSIYAESYLENAINKKLWVDTISLKINTSSAKNCVRIDTCSGNLFADLKQRLFQDWSVKDFYDGFAPSDKHFFDAFTKFPNSDDKEMTEGFKELKKRAKAENVQYIELMLGGISKVDVVKYEKYNEQLRSEIKSDNKENLSKRLSSLYKEIKNAQSDSAKNFITWLNSAHANIDDDNFTIRYLISARRKIPPTQVFQSLVGAFEASQKSNLVVGVNIVSREDEEVPMKDYKLHMEMFRFLHDLYPDVKYSMHAGELTLGLVKPEDLTFHINDAVLIAKAQRIGHGIDIPYEKDNASLLNYMSENKIAVEINLVSNEFILKVKEDRHPVMLYHNAGVPIVISTDDAGILRTNHIEQFVLLAKRYKKVSYSDIKNYILNSIEYSFIKEPELKNKIKVDLENKISSFEKHILESSSN